jgi:hypothetical protein
MVFGIFIANFILPSRQHRGIWALDSYFSVLCLWKIQYDVKLFVALFPLPWKRLGFVSTFFYVFAVRSAIYLNWLGQGGVGKKQWRDPLHCSTHRSGASGILVQTWGHAFHVFQYRTVLWSGSLIIWKVVSGYNKNYSPKFTVEEL